MSKSVEITIRVDPELKASTKSRVTGLHREQSVVSDDFDEPLNDIFDFDQDQKQPNQATLQAIKGLILGRAALSSVPASLAYSRLSELVI